MELKWTCTVPSWSLRNPLDYTINEGFYTFGSDHNTDDERTVGSSVCVPDWAHGLDGPLLRWVSRHRTVSSEKKTVLLSSLLSPPQKCPGRDSTTSCYTGANNISATGKDKLANQCLCPRGSHWEDLVLGRPSKNNSSLNLGGLSSANMSYRLGKNNLASSLG